MAYDFLGRKLEIGDNVVFMRINYRSLRTGKIKSMGKKKATIAVDQTNINRTNVQFFDQLIKI